MKKTLLFVLMLFCSGIMYSQITFEEFYSPHENYFEYAKQVQQTADGGYITSGVAYNEWDAKAFLFKTTEEGAYDWFSLYDFSISDYLPFKVIEAADGGFICGPATGDPELGDASFYLMKTDENGNLQWEKTFDPQQIDQGMDFIFNSDDEIVLSGFSMDMMMNVDLMIIIADQDGNETNRFVYSNPGAYYPLRIIQSSGGGYLVAGVEVLTESLFLQKLDASFNEEWLYDYPLDYGLDSENLSLLELDNGDIEIITSLYDYDNDMVKGIIKKFNSTGTLLNTYDMENTSDHYLSSAIKTDDNNLIITGALGDTGTYNERMLLYKCTPEGEIIWQRFYNMMSYNGGLSVNHTADNGYIISGYTGEEEFEESLYMVKTDEEGLIAGIDDVHPISKRLYVYPNPASDFIYLSEEYSTKTEHLSIITLSGQDVLSMSYASGMKIPVGHLSRGIYFLRIDADDKVAYEKFFIE